MKMPGRHRFCLSRPKTDSAQPCTVPRHSTLKLSAKGAAALVMAFMLISCLIGTLQIVAEGDGIGKADLINWCEQDYRERNFADLYETITLYDLYDEDFALYREAVDGYHTYIQYRQWVQAAASGDPEAQAQANHCLAALQDMAAAPQFSQNAALLTEFYRLAAAKG